MTTKSWVYTAAGQRATITRKFTIILDTELQPSGISNEANSAVVTKIHKPSALPMLCRACSGPIEAIHVACRFQLTHFVQDGLK